jgi:hypothetical protein
MNTRIPVLTLTVFGTSLASAQLPAAFYDFSTTNNQGTLGGSGTLSGGATLDGATPAPGFSGGNSLLLSGAEGAAGTYLNSNLAANALGFTSTNYTAGAWVQVSAFGGDSMVFGQLPPFTGADQYLHNGIRDNSAHLGHWGNDTTGSTNLNAAIGVNTWMHLDYRMAGNVQTIFVNGNYEAMASPRGTLGNTGNVLIGSSNNNGALPGRIDDAVVYNSSLRYNQIRYLAQGGNPNTLPAAANLGYMGNVNSLPGAAPTTVGSWNATFVRANGGMPDIIAAIKSLNSGAGTINTGTVPVINHNDIVGPGNVSGGPGLFGGDQPFVGDIPGDDNDFAAIYKSILQVSTPGDYTFGVHSDDGFALRVGNNAWNGVSGAGGIDFDDNRVVSFTTGTGDANTRAHVNLTAGNHFTEFVTFEGGGGAFHELYYAPGIHANDGDTRNWRLVGDTDTSRTQPGVSSAGWTVTSSAPNGPVIGNIADAQAQLLATGTTSSSAALNFLDPDTGTGGAFPGEVAFPRNSAGVDDNNFAVSATAQLVIPEADTFRFGYAGDDGGWLRINGQTGWTIVENVTGAGVVSDRFNAGVFDALVTDVPTGDSRTVGEIFLAAGTYTIEAGFFEIGGGAWWEVFGGDATFGNFGLEVLSASGSSNTVLPTLYLVPEASSSVLMILAGAFLMRRRR